MPGSGGADVGTRLAVAAALAGGVGLEDVEPRGADEGVGTIARESQPRFRTNTRPSARDPVECRTRGLPNPEDGTDVGVVSC